MTSTSTVKAKAKAAVLRTGAWNSIAIAAHLFRHGYNGEIKIKDNNLYIYPRSHKKGDEIIDCRLSFSLFILISGIVIKPGSLTPDKRRKKHEL